MQSDQAGQNAERVLLTGASGYLGGHILLELVRRGRDVRALLRPDSTHFEEKARWIQQQGAEVCVGDLHSPQDLRAATRDAGELIHCAALLGNWSRQNVEQYHTNVDGTAALMRVALERGLRRIVQVSSIAAIGASREARAMDESEVWSWSERPMLHYAKTKRESEERCLHALRNGLPVVVVNPAAMLGVPAQGGGLRGLCIAAREGSPRRLMRGGASFAHVTDVARSVVRALEVGRIGERYILGGANASWQEFYETSARLHGQVRRHTTWPNSIGTALATGAMLLDGLGFSRPRWAPERYRVWGWYGFADSSKAVAELEHVKCDLGELLRRVYGLEPSARSQPAAAQ